MLCFYKYIVIASPESSPHTLISCEQLGAPKFTVKAHFTQKHFLKWKNILVLKNFIHKKNIFIKK